MNFVFLGPPGAGKGTVAKRLCEEVGMTHISTGDLFRSAIKNKTELGQKIETLIDNGDLVPDDLTVALVKEKIDVSHKGYVLDGFPRTTNQAERLDEISSVNMVLDFVVDDEQIVQRLSGRRTCSKCGASYHLIYVPPAKEGVCDVCGGELTVRHDDMPESIKHRIEVYHKQTEPLVSYYRGKGIMKDINAEVGPDEVFSSVLALIESAQ